MKLNLLVGGETRRSITAPLGTSVPFGKRPELKGSGFFPEGIARVSTPEMGLACAALNSDSELSGFLLPGK